MAEQRHIESDDPEAARAEIERIRTRMSGTLDEIEENLVHTKEQIREALDVGAHIRRRPLHIAAGVLVAGLVLGFLTAGGRGEARVRKKYGARALHWENRARRLLAIAREQEAEIDRLEDQAPLPPLTDASRDDGPNAGESDVDPWEDDEEDVEDDDDSWDDEWDDEEEPDEESDEDFEEPDDFAYEGSGRWARRPPRFVAADRKTSRAKSGLVALRRALTEKVAQFATETAGALLEEVKKRR